MERQNTATVEINPLQQPVREKEMDSDNFTVFEDELHSLKDYAKAIEQ